MITAYVDHDNLQAYNINQDNLFILDKALWIDLLSPSSEEELMIEDKLRLDIPSREEMFEIESSSRLYKNKDALYMTANMLAQSESPSPKYEAVTFVLTQEKLITIRYIEPLAFQLFITQLAKFNYDHADPARLLITLLEATVDRLADILEITNHQLEPISKRIFRPEQIQVEEKIDYQRIIQKIGIHADLNTKARDGLVNFNRLVAFFGQFSPIILDNRAEMRLATLSKDIHSLSDYSSFISAKVNFLLDASLGMISLEQNTIVKLFSIVAVIFLPPTLIASIYGMNFKWMPELDFRWGYWIILGVMLISAFLPYKFFKFKKWL